MGAKNTRGRAFHDSRQEGQQFIIGPMLAYEGRADCTSLYCRRFTGLNEPGCIGWHCGVCDQPSSQYGHDECQERR